MLKFPVDQVPRGPKGSGPVYFISIDLIEQGVINIKSLIVKFFVTHSTKVCSDQTMFLIGIPPWTTLSPVITDFSPFLSKFLFDVIFATPFEAALTS